MTRRKHELELKHATVFADFVVLHAVQFVRDVGTTYVHLAVVIKYL